MSSKIRRASVVSVSKLSTSIDKAIASALKRHEVGASARNLLGRGDILGRVLRTANVVDAFKFAEDVAAKVNQFKGIDATPALTRIPGGILAGFIDRSQSLRQIGGG